MPVIFVTGGHFRISRSSLQGPLRIGDTVFYQGHSIGVITAIQGDDVAVSMTPLPYSEVEPVFESDLRVKAREEMAADLVNWTLHGEPLGREGDPPPVREPPESICGPRDQVRKVFWVSERSAWHVLLDSNRVFLGAALEDGARSWFDVSEMNEEIRHRIPYDRSIWNHLEDDL